MTKALGVVWACALWLFVSLAFAQSQADPKVQAFDPAKSGVKVVFAPQKSAAPALPQAGGQRAHVDPQGKLKDADPEESKDLSDRISAQFTRSVPTAISLYGPGGAAGVRLGEEYLEAIVATLGPDGKFRIQCLPAKRSQPNLEQSAPVSKSAGKEASDVR